MLSDHSTITISSAEEKILRMFTEHSIHLYKFQYPHEYAAIIDSSFPLEELESFCLSLSDSIQMGIGRPAEADCSLLRSYFDHEQSLSRTSEYLYLHKNTLQYKLDRIHKICGLNPRSFRDGVILYLALRLKEM